MTGSIVERTEGAHQSALRDRGSISGLDRVAGDNGFELGHSRCHPRAARLSRITRQRTRCSICWRTARNRSVPLICGSR